MAERLLIVEDAFVARGPGVLVLPRFTAPSAIRQPVPVRLRLPDGEERSASATVELAHMRGPLLPYAMYRLHGVRPEDVPAGTEIWSVDDASASVTEPEAGA